MNLKKLKQQYKKELMNFIFICSDNDKKLLIREPKQKTMEDFARFICLGLIFEMKGVYLRMFAEFEQIGNYETLFNYLNALNLETVDKWLKEFIENIDDTELKELAKKVWEEKAEKFGKAEFDIKKLI